MMPNPMQMISQFPKFMQQMRGQDPQQLLNQLMQSGRVSQQQLFQMQMAQQNCCCENREAIQGVNYNMATQSCDTRNTIQNTTRDIIDAMNCGFRSLDQRLTAQELAAKDAQIADKNQQLFMAQLAASQNAQNLTIKGYVENQFAYYNPRPVPAYQVQNPNCCYGNGYGCGSVA